VSAADLPAPRAAAPAASRARAGADDADGSGAPRAGHDALAERADTLEAELAALRARLDRLAPDAD
jgi:hypothetical protein